MMISPKKGFKGSPILPLTSPMMPVPDNLKDGPSCPGAWPAVAAPHTSDASNPQFVKSPTVVARIEPGAADLARNQRMWELILTEHAEWSGSLANLEHTNVKECVPAEFYKQLDRELRERNRYPKVLTQAE